MLFLLTGEVQIGKTRWLESLVTELADRGVPCAGVLAPGRWVPSEGEHADENGYEKLGIDNVLLPASVSLSPVGVTWPEPTAPSTKRARRRRRSWPGT